MRWALYFLTIFVITLEAGNLGTAAYFTILVIATLAIPPRSRT